MASVAVIGPDGSGKTTVSQMLERVAPFPVKYIYMGTNPLAGNVMLPTTRLVTWLRQSHDRRPRTESARAFDGAPVASWLTRLVRRVRRIGRLCNRLLEDAYRLSVSGAYQLAGRIVIYDRHPLFDSAPIQGDLRRVRRVHWWLISHFAPRPDLVVYLDAPVETLLARKQEFPRSHLEVLAERLTRAAARSRLVRVDAVPAAEAVCQETIRQIQKLRDRNEGGRATLGVAVRRRSPADSILRVLTYHRIAVSREGSQYNPSVISAMAPEFDRSMRWLSRNCHVLGVEAVLESLRTGTPLPDRSVLLTFDDAYRDFGEVAWPILRKYRLPALLFVPTGFAGGAHREFWWDHLYRAVAASQVAQFSCEPFGRLSLKTARDIQATFRRLRTYAKTLPHDQALEFVDEVGRRLNCPRSADRSVLNWDEIRELARDGVAIGSHTRWHSILTVLSPDDVRREISGAREDLSREIGPTAPVFAYPSGACDATTAALVKEAGYEIAFGTEAGHNRLVDADPLQLRRTNVTTRTTTRTLRVRLTKWGGRIDRLRQRKRVAGDQIANTSRASRVAYVMSRFPKLTETFVLYEMMAVEKLGVEVDVYPLLKARNTIAHPEAAHFVARAHFHAFMSRPVVEANLHYLWHRPITYLRTLYDIARRTWGSLNFFVGALAIFPKSVRFAYEMEQREIGHVHAHFANHPAVAALIVHRLTGIPFSFTAHGSDLHVDRRMLGDKIEASAFAVAISEFNRRLMIAEAPRHADKIHVVHCGVDPDVFRPARTSRKDGAIEILCVGSFEPIKGHRYLVEACRLLRDRGIEFTCHFVGQGPLQGPVERQIAESGLTDRVVVHGGLDRQRVARMVAESDVVVLASAPTKEGKREGIPVALMEAMAAGLPVISTMTGGIPELVESGETGLLVPPADPIALADALENLATDAERRRRMGVRGREKVLREFNLEMNASRLVSFFKRSQSPSCVGAAAMTETITVTSS